MFVDSLACMVKWWTTNGRLFERCKSSVKPAIELAAIAQTFPLHSPDRTAIAELSISTATCTMQVLGIR